MKLKLFIKEYCIHFQAKKEKINKSLTFFRFWSASVGIWINNITDHLQQ